MSLCSRQITFKASYLVETVPGKGSSFLFHIENGTAKTITLIEPVPSSAHWYARVGNRWLWRASSGAGGSYVDAVNEKGPVFAYQPENAPAQPKYITVPAHGNYEWTAGELEIPALSYRPSCARATIRASTNIKAVFAYAYLAPPRNARMVCWPAGCARIWCPCPQRVFPGNKFCEEKRTKHDVSRADFSRLVAWNNPQPAVCRWGFYRSVGGTTHYAKTLCTLALTGLFSLAGGAALAQDNAAPQHPGQWGLRCVAG